MRKDGSMERPKQDAPVLELRDLKVEVANEGRRTALVHGVDLTVGPGETVGLVGESGSGKTVTSLAVMQLLPANATLSGSARLNGQELIGLSDRELQRLRGCEMGMIFQEPRRSLNPAFTVGDQVAESVRQHERLDRKAAWARAVELFERVGIPDPARRARDYPHQFSGGMCQRVMLAMALACRPKLLIADEPTTALDVTVQRQVLELIRELQEEMELGVLLITHDLGVVAEVCDRAAVMHRGRVVEHATVVDLFDRPRDDYTIQLLGARELKEPPTALAAETTSNDVLVVRGLKKDFVLQRDVLGRAKRVHHAVRGVDFTVRAGETLSVVGESGAGKSTVGRMVLRLIEPDAGEIVLLGRDIASLKGEELRRMRAEATMIFQDPYKSLNPKRQIVHALHEPMLVQGGYGRSERDDRVAALMERVGLGPQFLERYPYEMSGGQLQRVAIARALVTDPRLVVCDEPVAALDMSIRAQVVELMRELQAERGLAYLFVSHDLSLVRAISDQIAVMRQGEIVELGTPDHLYDAPEHPYTRQLLSAVPAAHPLERTFRALPAA